MTIYEMALKYYPRLWDEKRLNALVEAGRLTKAQAKKIISEVNTDERQSG